MHPPTKEPSSLYWKATPTELGELLCAFDLAQAIESPKGVPAHFTDVVRSFEWFLNIKLGDPHDLKRYITRRKTRLTIYHDKLRGLLREYSMR